MCTDEHNVQDMCLRQPSCLASASLAEVLYVVPQRSCYKKPPNHTDGEFLTNFVMLILYEHWAGRVPETACLPRRDLSGVRMTTFACDELDCLST